MLLNSSKTGQEKRKTNENKYKRTSSSEELLKNIFNDGVLRIS